MSVSDMAPLRDVIAKYKLSADKSFGQHFLLDLNITDKIARAAGPLDGVTVMEIGPGPGGLTRSLLMAGAKKVVAIEMDDRFVPALDEIREASEGRFEIVIGNGLKINPADHGVTRIAANLPYNVGTKMLINWLTANPLFWSQAVLMFQKEVAQRVVAAPGGNAYGRLAILSQSVCNARLAFEVPANAFSPPPKVDSAVIVLEPLPEAKRFPDLKLLGEVTMAAFGQRRKMLRKSLKSIAKKYGVDPEPWCESCEIDPQRRPETLSVAEFQKLGKFLI